MFIDDLDLSEFETTKMAGKRGRRKGVKLDPIEVAFNNLNKLNFPGEFNINDDRTITWFYDDHNEKNYQKLFDYSCKIAWINLSDSWEFTDRECNETFMTFTIRRDEK